MRLRLAALFLCLATAAFGQAPPLPPAVRSVELIPGWREPGGGYVAALEIRLAPGWHTYWRAPGEGGIPPLFDWSTSENLAAVGYDWPRPVVFDSYGSVTIGYKDALVLPLRLKPAAAGAPVEARLDLFFGVCDEICIPAEARVALRLDPDAPQTRSDARARIEAALAARPLDARAGGVAATRCALAPVEGGYVLTARIELDASPRDAVTAVIEAEDRPDLWIGAAATRTEGRTVEATARLDALAPGAAIDRSALRLTLLAPTQAIEIRGCAGAE